MTGRGSIYLSNYLVIILTFSKAYKPSCFKGFQIINTLVKLLTQEVFFLLLTFQPLRSVLGWSENIEMIDSVGTDIGTA